MVERTYAPVKRDLLIWARKTASVSVEDAARAAGVEPDRLLAWESSDEEKPTLPQLRKLAEKYKRPLAVMLLPRPPKDFMPLRDFRRIAEETGGAMPPKVAHEVRLAQERRETAIELAEEIGAAPPKFTLRAKVGDDPEKVAAKARDFIGIDMVAQVKAARRGQAQAFDLWRRAIEDKGVLVFVMGGAHAPRIRDVRGFAIPAETFPAIAVNGRDRTNGRIFTLLHEFVHLMVGVGAVENTVAPDRGMPAPVRAIERFCNAVAASVLMPPAAIAAAVEPFGKDARAEWSNDEMATLAERFGVSREALLLRLVERGFASRRFYVHRRPDFEEEYEAFDEPSGESVIVKHHQVMIGRYGRAYARLVLEGYRDRHITMSAAAGLLGVQAKHIADVERQAYRAA